MESGGPNGVGPHAVPWDEAREVVTLILALAATLMVLSPVAFRFIDGQFDRAAFRSSLTGAGPLTGLVVIGAGILVATTPAVDVTPLLRTVVFRVALLVLVIALLAMFETLFAEPAGGVREFFKRFPTTLRFSTPGALFAGTAAWLSRRVVAFPAG
jgi:hypothetical protein